MTGQVKEELLTRRAELGVHVRSGRLQFEQVHRLANGEFLNKEGELKYLALDGTETSLPLPAGSLALTVCQTPIVCHKPQAGTPGHIRVKRAGGNTDSIAGSCLDEATSRHIFSRDGSVVQVEIHLAG